jgi:hypothetical protein
VASVALAGVYSPVITAATAAPYHTVTSTTICLQAVAVAMSVAAAAAVSAAAAVKK